MSLITQFQKDYIMNRQQAISSVYSAMYGSEENFERITRKAPTEGFTGRKGAKLNKRNRSADRNDKREVSEHWADRATTKCNQFNRHRED